MRQLALSPAARNDLRDVYLTIESDSADAASMVVSAIYREVLALLDSPFVGHLRDELGLPGGTRTINVYSYLVFYRVHESSVHIGRIIHGSRALVPSLFNGVDF